MPEQFRIIASVYRGLVDILRSSGMDTNHMAHSLGLPLDRVTAPQEMLSLEQVSTLWQLGFDTRGETIGLEVAQQIRLVDFQDVGVFLTATDNVADLLRQLSNYCALFSNVMELRTVDVAGGLDVSVHYHADVPLKNARLEFLTLGGPVLASQYLARPLKLEFVELPRARPADPAPWEQAFGVPIHWSAPTPRYRISPDEAQRQVLTRNEHLRKDLQQILDARLRTAQKAHPLDDVLAEITLQLSHQVPGVESVASALCTSPRTLQRRIAEENTTFTALLASTRESLAKHYLSMNMPSTLIAERLGYCDLPTFNRAFKRWTGQTPAQFAQQAKGEAG